MYIHVENREVSLFLKRQSMCVTKNGVHGKRSWRPFSKSWICKELSKGIFFSFFLNDGKMYLFILFSFIFDFLLSFTYLPS